MKWRRIIVVILTVLGMTIWFRNSGHVPPDQPLMEAPAVRPTRSNEVAAIAAARESKWKSFFDQVRGFTPEQIKAYPPKVKANERLMTLEALAREFGPDPIANKGNWLAQAILEDWARVDFEDAWSSCLQSPDEAARRQLLEKLLDFLVKTDPQRALVLYAGQARADPNFDCRVPIILLTAKASEGSDAFLQLLQQLPFVKTSRGNPLVFAEGFDFQKVSDGYRVLKAANPSMTYPGADPSNFLETWAERDPEAAYADWLNNGVVFGNGLPDLYEGLKKQDGEAMAAEWMAKRLLEEGDARDKVLGGLVDLAHRGKISDVIAIGNHLTDSSSRDSLYIAVLSAGGPRDPFARYPDLVNGLSSPQAIQEASRQMAASGREPDLSKISDSQFQAWGVTRQQLEQIFVKAPVK